MKTKTLTLTKEQIETLSHQLSIYEATSVAYGYYRYKLNPGSITAYHSLKVVFQGEQAIAYAKQFESEFIESAGSDEVGTGDYFGPVVVCAALVSQKDISLLEDLTIMDSKGLNDDQIIKIAPKLMQQLTYSVLVLDNVTYNRVHKTMNLNAIKANLHQKAYDHLKRKAGYLPQLCVVDQFMDPKRYYQVLSNDYAITHLTFTTKAENKYPAVACASIIARYTFLQALDQLSEHVGFKLPKGSGATVDTQAKALLTKSPDVDFKEIAKLHFKNTQRIFNQ